MRRFSVCFGTATLLLGVIFFCSGDGAAPQAHAQAPNKGRGKGRQGNPAPVGLPLALQNAAGPAQLPLLQAQMGIPQKGQGALKRLLAKGKGKRKGQIRGKGQGKGR